MNADTIRSHNLRDLDAELPSPGEAAGTLGWSGNPPKTGLGDPLPWATAALLLLGLLPFVLLAAYNRAAADDYCFASALHHQSFWAAQLDWYRHWTGRFVSTLMISAAAAGGIPSPAFVAIPLINIAALAGALVFLGHALFGRFASRTEILAAAGAVTAVFLASMPNVAEGIFWASGSLTYTLPAALLVVALAAAVHAGRAAAPGARRLFAALATACIFIAGGASETLAAVAFVGVALAAWSALRHRRSVLRLLPYALAAIAAGLVVATAPGVGERMAGFSRPSLAIGMEVLAKTLYYHVLGWTVFGFLLAMAGWELIVRWPATRRPRRGGPGPLHPAAAACSLALVVLAIVAPAALVRGAVPDRVLDIAYLAVLLGIPFVMFTTAAWLAAGRECEAFGIAAAIRDDPRLRRPLSYASLAVLALMLANGQGLQTAYADLLKGRAAAYAQSWEARYRELARCGHGECRVGALAAPPPSLAISDLASNPQDWKNRCVAELYDLQAVVPERR